MSVSAFMDESGKFQDTKVVSMGCVAALQDQFKPFMQDWGLLLRKNGLSAGLSGKHVLNPNKRLSAKVDAYGVENRTEALMPFIRCIRKHLQVVMAMATDVAAFQEHLPRFGNDPIFMTFGRIILQVIDFTPDGEQAVLVVDEDEATTLKFYKMYKRIKTVWPSAKKKLAAVSFADDKFLYGLQAADFIAALVRLEFDWRWNNKKYDYTPLWNELGRTPGRDEGRLWFVGIASGDRETMANIAADMDREWEKMKHEKAK